MTQNLFVEFELHEYWKITNLSGDSCGGFLIFIFYSHHNRQTVIVVLISERQVYRLHLSCITAAQMIALKIFKKDNLVKLL